jgi:hypothetical protein
VFLKGGDYGVKIIHYPKNQTRKTTILLT